MRRLSIAVLAGLAVSCVAPASANAASCGFLGVTSDWHNAANWTCLHVPTSADDVALSSPTSVQIPGAAHWTGSRRSRSRGCATAP